MKLPPLLTAALLSALCTLSSAGEDEWISLFNGKSFDGWKVNENADSWVIEDGALKTRGERAHLFYVGQVANHEFKNFEFNAEVKTTPGSNSGIYIHTKFQDEGWPANGYECQVINSNPEGGNYVEHKMTGSIYAVRNTWKAPVADNEWFTYRILVSGKTIRTYINDALVCEYTERENPWRPDDKKGRVLSSGTFALQAHDPGSVTRYRNIKVRLLPEDAESLSTPEADAELDRLITKFSNDNVPLIDIGIVAHSESDQDSLDHAKRRFGLSLAGDFGITSLKSSDTLAVITAKEHDALIEALKSAKEAGKKVIFDSQGAIPVDVASLKTRLKAIEASGLGWADFWVPGK